MQARSLSEKRFDRQVSISRVNILDSQLHYGRRRERLCVCSTHCRRYFVAKAAGQQTGKSLVRRVASEEENLCQFLYPK